MKLEVIMIYIFSNIFASLLALLGDQEEGRGLVCGRRALLSFFGVVDYLLLLFYIIVIFNHK